MTIVFVYAGNVTHVTLQSRIDVTALVFRCDFQVKELSIFHEFLRIECGDGEKLI